MSSGKKIGIGIVGVLIAIGIAYGVLGIATETSTEPSESPAPIEGLSGEVKIGLILPLSGDLATHGIENHEGS